jgi:hypothetical protein
MGKKNSTAKIPIVGNFDVACDICFQQRFFQFSSGTKISERRRKIFVNSSVFNSYEDPSEGMRDIRAKRARGPWGSPPRNARYNTHTSFASSRSISDNHTKVYETYEGRREASKKGGKARLTHYSSLCEL